LPKWYVTCSVVGHSKLLSIDDLLTLAALISVSCYSASDLGVSLRGVFSHEVSVSVPDAAERHQLAAHRLAALPQHALPIDKTHEQMYAHHNALNDIILPYDDRIESHSHP
jgi:hypothetical protein